MNCDKLIDICLFSYLLSPIIVSIALIKLSSARLFRSTLIPILWYSYLSTLNHWSPNIGIPISGTPAVIASSVDWSPPCVINNLIFGCSKTDSFIFNCLTTNQKSYVVNEIFYLKNNWLFTIVCKSLTQ